MSIATVSRVVNAVPYPVSDCARRPILRAIRKLGSRPDALARSLHQRAARTIGLLVPDIPTTPRSPEGSGAVRKSPAK